MEDTTLPVVENTMVTQIGDDLDVANTLNCDDLTSDLLALAP